MPDIPDGESIEIKVSARLPYILKNIGGVYSCSCPAWRNQSRGIEARSCKHLRSFRGEQTEAARIGMTSSAPVTTTAPTKAPPLLLAQTLDTAVHRARLVDERKT